jgi:quercetin dioxygenase-like cupin family protein
VETIRAMRSWNLTSLDVPPRAPRIVSDSADARVILVALPAGEQLQEHEVHERAFVLVVSGAVTVADAAGETTRGETGALFEFDPHERHEVIAESDARLLLLLTPWPGDGHPGVLTLDQKARAREHAAEHAELYQRDPEPPPAAA